MAESVITAQHPWEIPVDQTLPVTNPLQAMARWLTLRSTNPRGVSLGATGDKPWILKELVGRMNAMAGGMQSAAPPWNGFVDSVRRAGGNTELATRAFQDYNMKKYIDNTKVWQYPEPSTDLQREIFKAKFGRERPPYHRYAPEHVGAADSISGGRANKISNMLGGQEVHRDILWGALRPFRTDPMWFPGKKP